VTRLVQIVGEWRKWPIAERRDMHAQPPLPLVIPRMGRENWRWNHKPTTTVTTSRM
jgi:hypothetical protein